MLSALTRRGHTRPWGFQSEHPVCLLIGFANTLKGFGKNLEVVKYVILQTLQRIILKNTGVLYA